MTDSTTDRDPFAKQLAEKAKQLAEKEEQLSRALKKIVSLKKQLAQKKTPLLISNINVGISDISGTTIFLLVSSLCKILSLKKEYEKKIGYPSQELTFLMNDSSLCGEECTLKELEIQDGTVLTCIRDTTIPICVVSQHIGFSQRLTVTEFNPNETDVLCRSSEITEHDAKLLRDNAGYTTKKLTDFPSEVREIIEILLDTYYRGDEEFVTIVTSPEKDDELYNNYTLDDLNMDRSIKSMLFATIHL